MKGGTRKAMKAASASVMASRTVAWPTIFILQHFRIVQRISVNDDELQVINGNLFATAIKCRLSLNHWKQ
jgi:hypothetical protein